MTMKNTELVRFLPKCLSVIDIVINSLKITISGEKKSQNQRITKYFELEGTKKDHVSLTPGCAQKILKNHIMCE